MERGSLSVELFFQQFRYFLVGVLDFVQYDLYQNFMFKNINKLNSNNSIMTNIDNLNRKSIQLKSRLHQKQLEHGTYSFGYSKNDMLNVLNEYKTHKSIFKAASSVGVDGNLAMKWYSEGMRGNPTFRGFYLAIRDINDDSNFIRVEESCNPVVVQDNELDGTYKISQYGDGWSYTTYVDGEKIFIISNELDTLKEKVKAKCLPLD
jgi:hypothetical protein